MKTNPAMALAALALLSVASMAAAQVPTAYRLISITKWNSSANIANLQGIENNVSLACKAFFVSGISGYSLQRVADVLYGSHVKVYDFPTLVSYTNYSTCVSQQPGRSVSAAYEVWKNRVLFPINTTIAAATTGVYWAVNIANATVPANLVTLYTKVNTEIAGVTSVRQVGQNVAGTVSAPLQVAQVLSFLKPQGATAYLGYLNNLAAEGIATLDVEVSIKAIATSSRRILFAPTKLK